jgi:hypothetical protein
MKKYVQYEMLIYELVKNIQDSGRVIKKLNWGR